MKVGIGHRVVRILAVLAITGAVTLVCFRLIPVNTTTAGFFYLLAVLGIASWWGLLESVLASLACMLCFNFFFLPPIGTLTIADPQNWVALFAFLGTSIVASQLSARARNRTLEALESRREMERLYALSRGILLTAAGTGMPSQLAHLIAQIFAFPALALYDRSTGEFHRAGPEDLPGIEDKLRQAAVQGTSFQDEVSQTTATAIRLGGQPIGSLAMTGAVISDSALEAIANLAAIGLERTRAQKAANLAEAARQSEELKSTLLDAIAHEFKTPLTSIKAASSALLSSPDSNSQELVHIVSEECDRLERLVTEVIHMARLEAGGVQLNRQLCPARQLIDKALEPMRGNVNGRIELRIAADLPDIAVDPELVELAIRQLIDNALKYSPQSSAVVISAHTHNNNLVIRVSDQGPGIPEAEQARIFEKFYRGPNRQVTGTGLGLAIAREIVRSHGGDIWVESAANHGSTFSLSIPVAQP